MPELKAQCSVSRPEFKLQDFVLLQETYALDFFFQYNEIKFSSMLMN
jgi:hypothetical protein